MVKERTIFNYYNSDWGSISTYETRLVKLLIEDDAFFEKHINQIDQNEFSNTYFREIVGMMKDIYLNEGFHISPDMLFLRKQRDGSKLGIEEFKETLEMCAKMEMNESIKAQIEAEVVYHNLFYSFTYATNHAKDTLYGDYITTMPQLKKAAKRLVEDVERVKRNLELLDETDESKGKNDW